MLLLFRDQWKSGLDCFPSKRVYYSCIMHERVARSSLHRVFFLFSRDTKEHSTRLSTRKLREIAAGWMDVYAIFFSFFNYTRVRCSSERCTSVFRADQFRIFLHFWTLQFWSSAHKSLSSYCCIIFILSFIIIQTGII